MLSRVVRAVVGLPRVGGTHTHCPPVPIALWPQELPRLLCPAHVTQAGNQSHHKEGRQVVRRGRAPLLPSLY